VIKFKRNNFQSSLHWDFISLRVSWKSSIVFQSSLHWDVSADHALSIKVYIFQSSLHWDSQYLYFYSWSQPYLSILFALRLLIAPAAHTATNPLSILFALRQTNFINFTPFPFTLSILFALRHGTAWVSVTLA